MLCDLDLSLYFWWHWNALLCLMVLSTYGCQRCNTPASSPMHKIFWKVLNWNIRGLNDPDKWTLIFNKIRESGCQVICFQESKTKNVDISFLRQFCSRNFASFAFVLSVGRSGGIITIWDNSVFTGHTVFHNQLAQWPAHMRGRHLDSLIKFLI
jgi:hypothetical protein